MIIAKPTIFNTICWQWINQTYNAMLNYANRNATSTYTRKDIATSYFIASTSSISVALTVRRLLKSRTAAAKGATLYMLNSFGSFVACASAGFLNAWFMRQTEIKKGIDVLDPETGEVMGKSQKAARKAVL